MDNNGFDFSLNNQMGSEASPTSEEVVLQILKTLSQIENEYIESRSAYDASLMELQARVEQLEKYTAFLLSKNTDFKDYLANVVEQSKGKSNDNETGTT